MNRKHGSNRVRQNQRRIEQVPAAARYKHWKQWAVRGCIVLLCVGAVVVGGQALNAALRVTHWNVDASPSMQREVNRVLLAHDMDFWHARPMSLRRQLLHDIPDLADVLIQRQLPDTLNIQVRLRQRMGLWKSEEGDVYLVDEHGMPYRALRQSENVDLPIFRMHKKYLQSASNLLKILKLSSNKWFTLSSEIFTDGLGWKLNFSQGQQWILPFGVEAVHNVAILSRIVEKRRWSQKNWRVNTHVSNRWFFREAKHQEVI